MITNKGKIIQSFGAFVKSVIVVIIVIAALVGWITLCVSTIGCGMEDDYSYTQQEVFQEVNTDRIPELVPECPPCERKCPQSCIEKCWDELLVCKQECNTKCNTCDYYCERAFRTCWGECL